MAGILERTVVGFNVNLHGKGEALLREKKILRLAVVGGRYEKSL